MTEPTSVDYDPRAAKLAENIRNNLEHLRTCQASDPLLVKYFQEWKCFVEDVGPGRPVCRLITFLASMHETQDLTKIARETIETWIKAAKKGVEKAAAFRFRALAMYMFGDYAQATDAARKTVAYLRAHGLSTGPARENLAYFLAEHYFHQRHRFGDAQRKEILDELIKLAGELEPLTKEDPSVWDTLGWLKIATADEQQEDQVREGLEMCRRALELIDPTSSDYQTRKAYLRLHEERAFQQLLEKS